MQLLPHHVLLTLAYSQIFFQPLRTEEVQTRLIKSRGSVSGVLERLQKQGLVKRIGDFWALRSLSGKAAVVRKKRERLSDLKIQELQPLLKFARVIPWVVGVAVTGSVAVSNAEAKDDVDLLIVTQKHRLWLVRPLLVIFSFFKRKRRSWNHEEANSWCLNLWLEEDQLAVARHRQTLYTAYEVCQARWLIDQHGVQHRFLTENSWVADLLPSFYKSRTQPSTDFSYPARIWFLSHWWDLVNAGAFTLQHAYMFRHMTRETVTPSMAFFHPRDTRGNIMLAWREVISNL